MAIVRLSGPASQSILDRLVQRSSRDSAEWESHRLYHGRALLDDSGLADEVLAVLMRAPRSYTREDVAEVHCHGGRLLPGLAVEACVRLGARLAAPGEFTLRAFLNGRLDLSQAEAVLELIRASSRSALRLAARGLEGELSRRVRELRLDLLDWLARLEAEIDFGDEVADMGPDEAVRRLERAEQVVRSLLRGAEEGRLRSEGILTVLVGAPNAGKSTLLNLLLGEDRALVTPYPGTTRDRLEETAVLDGLLFRLVDTAGLRVTQEPVELLGMERTREALSQGELVVWILDGSLDWPEIELSGAGPHLVVLNKRDLGARLGRDEVARRHPGALVLETCLLTPEGGHDVREALVRLGLHASGIGEGVHVLNRRQVEALWRAAASLRTLRAGVAGSMPAECLCVDLREAVSALGELTGEDVTEGILDRIFSTFCLGK